MVESTQKSRVPVTGTALHPKKSASFVVDFYSTAIGKKYVMAFSGIAMLGFVLFHMVGNLKMYLGPTSFDHYAEFLQELLYPVFPRSSVLWILRGGLALMLVAHLHSAWSLTVLNRRARPIKYQSKRDYEIAGFASRTMRWSGIIVLCFIVWHLLDMSLGLVNTIGTDGVFVKSEVYENVVRSFQRWPVSVFYILANLLLGMHLYHGVWSIFQSLGLNNPRFNSWRRNIAKLFAVVVVVGNVSFPIAVLVGIVSV